MDGQGAIHQHESGLPLVMIVADDRHHEASALAEILKDEGIEAMVAGYRDAANTALGPRCPDVIIVDEGTALIMDLAVLLSQLRGRFTNAVIALMTSWCPKGSTIESALESLDGRCLEKPIDVGELVELAHAVSRARQQRSVTT